jgi:hypothetical protein
MISPFLLIATEEELRSWVGMLPLVPRKTILKPNPPIRREPLFQAISMLIRWTLLSLKPLISFPKKQS